MKQRSKFANFSKYIQKTPWILLFTLLLWINTTHAQQPEPVSGYSRTNPSRYELTEIRFDGNTSLPAALLRTAIASRASDLSFTRRITGYIATELKRNPATPAFFEQTLSKIQRELRGELRYLDRLTADQDTIALITFYRQNGFHQASVNYEFLRNQKTGVNTLLFHVTENKQADVDTVVYYGLDDVAEELREQIEGAKTLKRGTKLTATALGQQNEAIVNILRNNGYASAQYRRPIVTNILPAYIDSITVPFILGKRKRIAHISYVDSSASYTYLSPSVQQAFVEIKEGDWYNQSAVQRSVNRLYSVGLFSLVVIDTTSALFPTEAMRPTDSTISLNVITRTGTIYELGGGPVIGQEVISRNWNVGLEARYVDKNFFGHAEQFNPFVEAFLLNANDLTTIFSQGINATQFEIRGGIKYSQPALFKIFDRRVALDGEVIYSQQRFSLALPLRLESFIGRVTLPIELYDFTLFNSAFVGLTFDRQAPLNYEQTLNDKLAQAKTTADTLLVKQQLTQYGILDEIVNKQGKFLTNSILTVQLRGDKRDHPFTPRNGYVADVAVHWGTPLIGSSNFLQAQVNIVYFTPMAQNLVFATKFRAGHTFLFNPTDALGFYVPFERQFFTGGSNSLRGWEARALRAVFKPREEPPNDNQRIFDQIVGSASIIEGSVEVRWNFREPASQFDSFWSQWLARAGITGFIDFGNTFNSLQDKDTFGTMTLSQILTNLAIAAGAGFRLDTPAGPLRIDLAARIYDPLETARWIFERPLAFRVQIGLGHAF